MAVSYKDVGVIRLKDGRVGDHYRDDSFARVSMVIKEGFSAVGDFLIYSPKRSVSDLDIPDQEQEELNIPTGMYSLGIDVFILNGLAVGHRGAAPQEAGVFEKTCRWRVSFKSDASTEYFVAIFRVEILPRYVPVEPSLFVGFSWSRARGLAAAGARVRRALWDDRYIFWSEGGLFWIADYAGTYVRLVRAEDFLRGEFLANDWTNVDPDQGVCVGLLPIAASLSVSPASIIEMGSATATLLLGEMSDKDRVFRLSSHPAGRCSHAASVTVVAGALHVNFVVTAQDVDVPSGVVVSASNPIYAPAQASLAIGEYVAPPAPVMVRVVNGIQAGPGDYFLQTVRNPFSAAARVNISGVVDDGLLLNGVLVYMGTGGGFPAQSLTLPAGGSFTIAVRNRPFSGQNYASIDAEVWFSIQ